MKGSLRVVLIRKKGPSTVRSTWQSSRKRESILTPHRPLYIKKTVATAMEDALPSKNIFQYSLTLFCNSEIRNFLVLTFVPTTGRIHLGTQCQFM